MNTNFTRRDFLRIGAAASFGLATRARAVGFPIAEPCKQVSSTKAKIVVGLDIGSSKVCVAVAERFPDGAFRILGIGEAPSRASKWGIDNPPGTRCSVLEALMDAENKADVMIGNVVLGLKAAPQARLRNQWAIIDFLRQHEDDERIAEAFDEATWNDIYRIADFASAREDALLHDLYGQWRPSENRFIARWNDHPLVEISQVVSAPVATAEAVLSPEEKQRGALVIDMGAGTTEFCVIAGGLVHSDCIPVGNTYLAIEVPPEMAARLRPVEELIARLYPNDGRESSSKICGAGRRSVSRTERFDPMRVMHTVELMKARLEARGIRTDSLRAGVYLTGGAAMHPEVREYAEWIFGIPAQAGRGKRIAAPASSTENARFCCAIGLAKLGNPIGA